MKRGRKAELLRRAPRVAARASPAPTKIVQAAARIRKILLFCVL